MAEKPSNKSPDAPETTGRYIVTFKKDAAAEGMRVLAAQCGATNIKTSRSKDGQGDQQLADTDDTYFELLGMAVVKMADVDATQLASIGEESPFESIEPEIMMHINESVINVPTQYLRGYSDACQEMLEKFQAVEPQKEISENIFTDGSLATWGLQATGVADSRYSGDGVRVAVLDTGVNTNHPDFAERSIKTETFISGESVEDLNGHGTHCIGTACGPLAPVTGVRRYGVAYKAEIFAGKVLSNRGSGPLGSVIAGIEWAIRNRCQIASLSLSANSRQPLAWYTIVADRAMEAGTLLIAAAGNNASRSLGDRGFVAAPANSPSVLAVGAVDRFMGLADFSAGSVGVEGGKVDIAAPGIAVFSAWTGSSSSAYKSINGTSMATPHVAGIAALYAEQNRSQSAQSLWRLLVSQAQSLNLSSSDVGAGLVRAP